MSPDQVAETTGHTRQTIYNWIKSGELPAKKIGRTWLVNRQDLDKK